MTLTSGDDSLQEHQSDPLRPEQFHRHRPTVCALSDLDHAKGRIEQACPGGIVSSHRRTPQAGSKGGGSAKRSFCFHYFPSRLALMSCFGVSLWRERFERFQGTRRTHLFPNPCFRTDSD